MPISMRPYAFFLCLLFLPIYATQPANLSCPFNAPLIQQQDPSNALLELFRRQNNCQIGYNACTNLGVATACCSTTAICTPDGANMVACCPTGATCTGSLSSGPTVSTTGGLLLGGTTTTAAVGVATSTSTSQSTVSIPAFHSLSIPTFRPPYLSPIALAVPWDFTIVVKSSAGYYRGYKLKQYFIQPQAQLSEFILLFLANSNDYSNDSKYRDHHQCKRSRDEQTNWSG